MIDLNKMNQELALVAAKHRMETDPKKRGKLLQERKSLMEQIRAVLEAQAKEDSATEVVESVTPEAGAALNPDTKAYLNGNSNQQNGQQQSETKAENNKELIEELV